MTKESKFRVMRERERERERERDDSPRMIKVLKNSFWLLLNLTQERCVIVG